MIFKKNAEKYKDCKVFLKFLLLRENLIYNSKVNSLSRRSLPIDFLSEVRGRRVARGGARKAVYEKKI